MPRLTITVTDEYVWAGDRLLAFELAEPEERTVAIDREAGGGEDES